MATEPQEPLHQMVAQHRVQQTMSGDTVIEFILCMKRLLSCHGDLQHSCILCKKLLPTRWMIILCEGWVGGWGPQYRAQKRERGPARVPGLLGEDFAE